MEGGDRHISLFVLFAPLFIMSLGGHFGSSHTTEDPFENFFPTLTTTQNFPKSVVSLRLYSWCNWAFFTKLEKPAS